MKKRRTAPIPIIFGALTLPLSARHSGWMYLAAILDWYSRSIVSWELDHTLELPFVLTAMQRDLAQATPQICNSDQGSHFTSPQSTQLLLDAQVRISMDGKGRALDTIFTERLWRTIKYEEVYLHEYASPREARQGLSSSAQFYNQQRFHQALAYQTPAALYFGAGAPENWSSREKGDTQ